MGVYNEEELLSIIKRMQNDGRSENEIASVIKEYEKENPPGKTNGDVVDANATSGTAASGTGTGLSKNNQTNTGLESGSGSLELQDPSEYYYNISGTTPELEKTEEEKRLELLSWAEQQEDIDPQQQRTEAMLSKVLKK